MSKIDEMAGATTAKKKRKEQQKTQQRTGLFRKVKKKLTLELTSEEMEELEIVGYHLSKRFDYLKLMKAADRETAKIEGRGVHGYMKIMYRNYEWLYQNDVLDIACYFALQEAKLQLFNAVSGYDFEHAIINVIPLPKKVYFDEFPEFPFDSIIILTQGEPYENAVTWIENQPWVDEDGYDTTVTLAPCNFLNTGFVLWELPVIVLKDAVGMDTIFFDGITDAAKLQDTQEQIMAIQIYKLRNKEKTSEGKYKDLQEAYDQLEEKHEFFKAKMRAGDTTDVALKIKRLDKQFDRRNQFKSYNYKKIAIIMIIIFVTVLFITAIGFLIFKMIPQTGPVVPEGTGILLDLFSGGGL